MYVHALEGSWRDHPFWRTRFLIVNGKQLQQLRESSVAAIVIDDEKGRAPRSRTASAPVRPAPRDTPSPTIVQRRASIRKPVDREAGPRKAAVRSPRISLEPSSMPEERKRAVRIVAKAMPTIQGAFDDMRLGKLVRLEQLASLVEEIAASITRNPFALASVAHLKARHEYTYHHSVAVSALMISLARKLKLDKELIQEIGLAGLLHDLGMAVVPKHLLDKPAALSAEELAVVRSHSERGHAQLEQNPAIGQIVLDVVRHHHERVDGTGYPDRLRGEEISIYARMGAICDVYDALTSTRAYKDALSPGGALRVMQDNPGQFDPDILDAFIHSIGIYPVGGLVRLRSDRLAVVLDVNLDNPLSPPVRTFFCAISQRHLSRALCRPGNDEIIGIERPDRWGFGDWEALRRELMETA